MAGPGRQPNERDLVQALNGSPAFLGVLTSVAAARVNNATTAVPFNATPLGAGNLINTLAGKTLLLQPVASGLLLPSADVVLTIVQQATAPVLTMPQSLPGVLVTATERVILVMRSDQAYLQWVAVSGTASCLVWELT